MKYARLILCFLALGALTPAFAAGNVGGMTPPGGGGGMTPGGGGGNLPDQPGGGGGVQPDQPGGTGGVFVYDTFLTGSSGNGVDVRDGLWISTERTATSIASNSSLKQMAVGAGAGSTALIAVDLSASTGLTEIPACAFAGCENLVSVILPTSVTNVAEDAFIGCPKLISLTYNDAASEFNFESELVEVTEGDSLVIRVRGGCADCASSVKLCLSYQTAAASDLNLAKASVDGVAKKLSFPLTLTWSEGEISTHEISIPVKADSAKEVDEQLTFQLASATGCELEAATVCTAVIHDAKGVTVSSSPLAYGLAEPADAGRVIGATRKAEGKSVSLTAKANSGYVFVGWYDGETRVAETARLSLVMPAEDVCYTARFATKAEDVAAISCALDGQGLSDAAAVAVSNTCGVCLSYPIDAAGLSSTKVTASGLPSGLKLVYDKVAGTYSITGVPTAVSKTNSRTGLVTPSTAKITVTSAGKSKRTFVVLWTIGALPTTAVGKWNGVACVVSEADDDTPIGNFTLTATAAGAVTVKAVTEVGTASFSGKGWIENEDGTLTMAMTNKTYGVISVQLDPSAEWTDDSISARLSGGKFGDEIVSISAYRNPYGKTGKVVENADAQAVLLAMVGNYSIVVMGPDGEELSGAAKIAKTGNVTVSGKLSDGKKSFSMSGVLEIRAVEDKLIPCIRLIGVAKYGCVWCNEEDLK